MRQETITIYKFSELLPKAQEKVLEKFWDINIDGDWWYECVVEDFKDKLDAIGFEDAEIHFSGFCCQGDGASFDARVNLEKIIKHLVRMKK